MSSTAEVHDAIEATRAASTGGDADVKDSGLEHNFRAARPDWPTHVPLAITVFSLIGTVLALGVIRPAHVAYYHGLGLELSDVDVAGPDVAGYTLGLAGISVALLVLMALAAVAVVRLEDRFFNHPIVRLLEWYQTQRMSLSGLAGISKSILLVLCFVLFFYGPVLLFLVPIKISPRSIPAFCVSSVLAGVGGGMWWLALRQVSAKQTKAMKDLLVILSPTLLCFGVVILVTNLLSDASELAMDVRSGHDVSSTGFLEAQTTRVLLVSRGTDPLGLCGYDAVASRVAKSGDTIYLVIRGREHPLGRAFVSPVVPVRAEDYDVIDVDAQRSAENRSVCIDSVRSA